MAVFSKMEGASKRLQFRFLKEYVKENVYYQHVRTQRIIEAAFDHLKTTPGESYEGMRHDWRFYLHEELEKLAGMLNTVETALDVSTLDRILRDFVSSNSHLKNVVYDDFIRDLIKDLRR
jgi:hypothetical protein